MIVDIGVQLIATAILLWGLYEMGNNKLRGPLLAAVSEVLWVGVGFMHGVWGLIILSVILAVMQARNFIKWRRLGTPW